MISLLSAWAGLDPQFKKPPNIGDRFIEDAVRHLLREVGGAPDEFQVFFTRRRLDRRTLAAVNQSRALLLCGSNLFHRDFWPKYCPLRPRLGEIRAPIVPFGWGWGGEVPEAEYKYTRESIAGISHIAGQFPIFSVRDPHTKRLLESQAPEVRGRIRVTGCPVRFRHNRGQFDTARLAGGRPFAPARILFSPNERLLLDEHAQLFRRIRELYPAAAITVAHNQASTLFSERLVQAGGGGESAAARMGNVRFFHAADTESYYRLFAEHDFQIGFRLHNHMVFLSHSKPSLTVETDGRTAGFAEAYGVVNLRPEEAARLERGHIEQLLESNAERLAASGPERWRDMEALILAIAALPEPRPRPFWRRWIGS